MLYFEDFKNLPPEARDCVVLIGNFDGVHLGHQALIARARKFANDMGKSLGVLTFEPHPHQLFRPDEPPCRITPHQLKVERLAAQNVDIILSLPFNWDFASQSAEAFVQHILIEGLAAAHVIVGYDFKFGQLRQGTPDTIKNAGLAVSVIDEIRGDSDASLSSSRVRQLLRHGKIAQANDVLGWNWEIRGEVFKGDQRGRELGYPTANIRLADTIHPAYGIYACFVKLTEQEDWMMGATNIGIRPMFEVPMAQVETFIFDFDREIYGETLSIRPIERLRGEAKFNSLDDLIIQMKKDCDQARAILTASL